MKQFLTAFGADTFTYVINGAFLIGQLVENVNVFLDTSGVPRQLRGLGALREGDRPGVREIGLGAFAHDIVIGVDNKGLIMWIESTKGVVLRRYFLSKNILTSIIISPDLIG